MTEYKENVLEYLKNNLEGILTVYIDGNNEICIKTNQVKNFIQQCAIIQESLSIASPDFKGQRERVTIRMENDVINHSIILNPNPDDLKMD